MSTIYLFTIAALLCLVSLSVQESCTSNLYIETETSVPSSGKCPVAWVNLNNKCNLFSTLYKEKRTSTACITNKDCIFGSMDCYSQKCTPMFRLVGDSCVNDNQCLGQAIPNPNLAQFVGPKCINSKCSYYKYENSRRVGEVCQFEDSGSNTKTFYDCNSDGVCVSPLAGTPKCVQKVIAKKGESCTNADTTKRIVCDSGLYCKYAGLTSTTATCVETIQNGQPCVKSALSSDYVPCASGYVCRQNSNSDTSTTCKRIATYGQFCVSSQDCAYTSSSMVECIDNTCKRLYGTSLGGSCKDDRECFSAYCSSEGKCANPAGLKCSDTISCPTGSSCACGGKSISATNGGTCAAPCTGAYYDVAACIYNLGVSFSSAMVGVDSYQYVDEDSSLFTGCRSAYSKYYSCLRKSWTDAGIATKGDMEGVSLSSYSVSDSAILPERNAAPSNNTIGMLSFMIIFVFATLF